MEKKQTISTKRIVLTAMMAALTIVGSAIRITIPVDIAGTTSFHLGNVMCALSGILLGPWLGGLAAGIGSFLYDMTNPAYVSEAWITFLTKGAYGLFPGLVMLLWKNNWGIIKAGIATASGAVVYAAAYLFKSYYWSGIIKHGLTHEAALISMFGKIPATVFNAVVAIIFAPILAVSIRKALEKNQLTLR
ncbi:MAG: ECF transporter S component [Oscillospiraceae bacterium]|nr:ECF transporter S component [Oscillospiraceae bacterium]